MRTPVAGGGGERDRDEGARPVLEQQQFDREQHGSHRGAERRAMPAAAPAASSVLRSSAVMWKQLPDHRAQRAARGDDWALRAERPARADRDRGRQRLEEHHLRRHAALVEEHLLHRLGNPVPANRLRSIARDEPDENRSDNRDDDHEWP
jgi:hypothetical protein